jgi:cardiolipin synthase
MIGTITAVGIHFIIEVLLILRVMLRKNRQPASRIAWVAVIAAVPIFGMLAYLLFGEVNIGRKRVSRYQQVIDRLRTFQKSQPSLENVAQANVPAEYEHLFQLGRSVSRMPAVGGNRGRLMADSNATIESMVADIDAAVDHVHVLFYIWLPDGNGLKMVDALKRAAGRGVKCRAMVDDLGSRLMLKSEHWSGMRDAGVETMTALPIGNPLLRPLRGRIDLRNHRKILIVDSRVTYCGSQNCADPEFRVKAKYAPWVDAVIRFEGPIVKQNQLLFCSDWMANGGEILNEVLAVPSPAAGEGFPAQVIATGPTGRASAMPEVFQSLIYAARHEVTISTPYYVPNESMQQALCAAAHRGVKTTIIFPARNDSWIVAGASRSYYAELLEAGVEIHEYVGGLLHTKSLTLDGTVTLIGSANMDRRSFDLNYENNILFYDRDVTAEVIERQREYLSHSNLVTRQQVETWSMPRRLWNNTLATVGPIL